MAGALPSDWLAFATCDLTDVVAQALAAAAVEDAAATDAMRGLLESQPLRGALAVSAAGDRIALDTASDPPTGYPTANADRGLSDEVPGDALYYSESGNVGAALGWLIGSVKEAALASGEGAEMIGMAEAALGGDLEEVVAWIGDAAMVAGVTDASPYAGVVINPNDMDAAERRHRPADDVRHALGARIQRSGSPWRPSRSGASRSRGSAGRHPIGMEALGADAEAVVVDVAVTDDRVLIGVGDAFVRTALGLDEGSSLAASRATPMRSPSSADPRARASPGSTSRAACRDRVGAARSDGAAMPAEAETGSRRSTGSSA